MNRRGELNLGQLVRETYRDAALSVGFTTYDGTVTAANNWDEPAQLMSVRPALPESYEALFHELAVPDFYLDLHTSESVANALRGPRLQRAIGVIYRPHSERQSHYFQAQLTEQFDAVVHFDRTQAVVPLDGASSWNETEAPETFPTGL